MQAGSGVVLLLVFLAVAALVPPSADAADTTPPTIVTRWWSPKYPIAPENATIFAEVTDSESGVRLVEAIWCYEPPFLCQYPVLVDNGTQGDQVAGDGIYTAPVETHTLVEGASYRIHAVDNDLNSITTDKIWALFPTRIAVTLTTPALAGEPGQDVAVSGTAFYGSDADPEYNATNETAPAEGAVITVAAGSSTAQATVDASGAFTATLTAPMQEATFALTATASDRSLTGSAEGTLAVSLVPRPDLLVENVQLPASPVAGQPTTIRFDVKNIGSADAVSVRILTETRRGEAWTPILDQRVTVARGGGRVTLEAAWTPVEGTTAVRVTIDPDGEVQELDETNSVRNLPVLVAPGGLPLLWIGVGAGIAAAAVAVGIGLAVRRKRSRST